MAESNKVQLKREEVVGNDVVLSDIFPRTDTDSIEDSSRGISLNQTLNRIFNDINDKLSRNVNSVNGRSGVVVLTAEDVGLGNVTNVSYTDIKQWVIEQIKLGFDRHKICLFLNLEEAEAFANTHGEDYNGTPFYSDHGYMNPELSYTDLRAHIGMLIYDEELHQLVISHKAIPTIGETDNSIIYNEKLEYHDSEIDDKDYRGGRIGVNIYKYEDALKLREGSTKEDSGLYIDKDKIRPNAFRGLAVYGDDEMHSAENNIGVEILNTGLSRNATHDTFGVSSNVSGINAFDGTDDAHKQDPDSAKTYSVILPSGVTQNVFGMGSYGYNGALSNGLHVSTNYSMCIVPREAFDPVPDNPTRNKAYYAKNWPTSAPDAPTGYGTDNESFLSVNLEKTISTDTGTPVSNISGLRINTEIGDLSESWFGTSDDSSTSVVSEGGHTGGLSVNVGKFLEIGRNTDPSDIKTGDDYYEDGKVNVRLKENGGLEDGGNNDIQIELYESRTTGSTNSVIQAGGGLSYVIPHSAGIEDPDRKGLSVARGLALRPSMYKADGSTTEFASQLSVSVVDTGFGRYGDLDPLTLDRRKRLYGGLRYLVGSADECFISALAVRVNNNVDPAETVDDAGGTIIKRGSEGLHITNDNVLGVQLDSTSGLEINYMTGSLCVKLDENSGITVDPETGALRNTGGGGGGSGDIELGPGLYWG